MPFARVSEDSVLLTAKGWRTVGSVPRALKCFGADRHGKVVNVPVTISSTDIASQEAFVGTASAFGAFIADTRLMLSNGDTVSLSKVVENGLVADLFLESLLQPPPPTPLVLGIEEVWEALVSQAAFSTGTRMALRCYEARTESRGFPRIVCDGGEMYCLVEYADLARRLASNGSHAICAVAQQWLRNSDEARDEIDRGATLLLCLLLASRIQAERWYRLDYDGLQHTSYICICESATKPAPVAKGACAFFGPAMKQAVTVSWEEKTWSPLCCGFFLASS